MRLMSVGLLTRLARDHSLLTELQHQALFVIESALDQASNFIDGAEVSGQIKVLGKHVPGDLNLFLV